MLITCTESDTVLFSNNAIPLNIDIFSNFSALYVILSRNNLCTLILFTTEYSDFGFKYKK